jgi:LysR family nitrogen assimilation transcriptional regulator
MPPRAPAADGIDRRMSLEQLHALVTIADAGSLTRAARQLHISQPPLSRKLQALEAELGLPLFERRADGMRPTAAGSALIDDARQILHAVAEAAARARGERRDAGGDAKAEAGGA